MPEQILTNVEWISDEKDVVASMNTIANVGNMVAGSFTKIMSASIQLQQSNLTLVRSYRSVRDAKRELNRESRRGYELDMDQARLNVLMAERQRILTIRTGRYLDVAQANLNVKKSIRDVDTTQMGIDDKTRKNRENMMDAELQLEIAMGQRRLMMIQLGVQMSIMFTTIIAMVVARWADITAQVAQMSLLTKGLFLGAAAGIIGGSIALVSALTPEMPEGTESTEPGGQTEVGQVRRIQRGGLMRVHTGESLSRPTNNTTTNSSAVINVQSSSPSAYDAILELKRRFLGLHSTRLNTPMGIR